MHKKTNKRGFTLVEMLVSTTVFIMISTMAASLYINVSHYKRKTELEAAIVSESRALLEKIAREVRNNTIDYEEYYNQMVLAKKFGDESYGIRYGEYAKNFYHPGVTYASLSVPPTSAINNGFGAAGRKGLGAECNDTNTTIADKKTGCPVEKSVKTKLLKRTLDTNVGKNWWYGPEATAFCDSGYGGPIACNANKKNLYVAKELYLISADGKTKTIFGREIDGSKNEGAVALLKIEGQDLDNDTVIDVWEKCEASFNCKTGPLAPDDMLVAKHDLDTKAQSDTIDDQFFIPLTPRTVNITNLSFIVSPLEDPRKAFDENTNEVQIQPHVTILLEIEPSDIISQNFAGILPKLQIQTSVTSRVMQEVKSYSLY